MARELRVYMGGAPLMERESGEEGFFSIGGDGMDERGIRETEDAEDGG